MYKNKPHLFFFLLLVFITVIKLPSILTDDIQPWDEGMYALRVNSISNFGDILDQSAHSLGGFYSASHPPLLIWTGYLFTSVLGDHAYVYKLVVFCFGLLCLIMIYLTAIELYRLVCKEKEMNNASLFGLLAAMIFSGNILFHIFSQRFQFDMPYSFFIIGSFYFFIRYLNDRNIKYIYYTGIMFGLCLMVKILVGFFIPIVIFLFFIASKKDIRFKDVLLVTVVGVVIAAPWHIYMVVKSGSDFLDYFIWFHIFKRAVSGVEENVKASGPLYHVNYFLTIIPFGILAARKLYLDIKNYKKLDIYTMFIDIWFLCGFFIITVFRTKLESYTFLILLPACFIIPSLIFFHSEHLHLKRRYLALFLSLNLIWYSTENYRDLGKVYLAAHTGNILLFVGILLLITAVLYFIYLYLINKLTPKNFLIYFIISVFFISGFWYLYRPPRWENTYVLSGIKNEIVKKNIKEIAYIGLAYHRNPQFSYYFDGLDVGWNKSDMKYRYINGNSATDSIGAVVSSLNKNTAILVEKDGINRGVYQPSELFINDSLKPEMKTPGYELYIK